MTSPSVAPPRIIPKQNLIQVFRLTRESNYRYYKWYSSTKSTRNRRSRQFALIGTIALWNELRVPLRVGWRCQKFPITGDVHKRDKSSGTLRIFNVMEIYPPPTCR